MIEWSAIGILFSVLTGEMAFYRHIVYENRSPLSPSALWEEGEEKGDQSEGEGEWVSGFGSWVILDFRNGRSDNLLKERQKKK
ncbi:hypothetical protein AAC387_Pa01g1113 [Persea americana]